MSQETKIMVADAHKDIVRNRQRIFEALNAAKMKGEIKIMVIIGENIAQLKLLTGQIMSCVM